ncbi:MAG: queuosine salvage family protein, partial [Candidatus Methylomirabilales bacterium]
ACAERAYRSDPHFFTAERLWRLSPQDLKGIFSDRGDPSTSTLDRIGERLHLLREAAASLLHWYQGDVWVLYERSGGSLGGGTGLLNLLAQFEAYRDPLKKKSYLLLMILSTSKIWVLQDLELLRFPVDNHFVRVALRTGMIQVKDKELQERLRGQGEVTAGEERALREAAQQAGALLIRASRRTVFELDTILWHIGRSCCFYEHLPICGPRATVHPCLKRDYCSLVRDTDYPCPDTCPLDGTCFGSLDDAYATLREPRVETHFY